MTLSEFLASAWTVAQQCYRRQRLRGFPCDHDIQSGRQAHLDGLYGLLTALSTGEAIITEK
jgi:hypothetical protein